MTQSGHAPCRQAPLKSAAIDLGQSN